MAESVVTEECNCLESGFRPTGKGSLEEDGQQIHSNCETMDEQNAQGGGVLCDEIVTLGHGHFCHYIYKVGMAECSYCMYCLGVTDIVENTYRVAHTASIQEQEIGLFHPDNST